MNARIRVFLTVVSLVFAGLLAIQFVATLLHRGDRPNPSTERQRTVDRPADAPSAPNPPRAPSGRSPIRHVQSVANAG
ncbi:MAG: hypothetical protein ACM3II_00650 [Rhodospirillaceae bacterium]